MKRGITKGVLAAVVLTLCLTCLSYQTGGTYEARDNATAMGGHLSGDLPGERAQDAAAGTPGLAYELISNNTAYRVSKGTVTSGEVRIPASYNGLPVREIGNSAFIGTRITAIYIPESVTSINAYALSSCASLASITVDPDNPNYTSERGILYDKAKTNLIQVPRGISGDITIPAGVRAIGSGAIENCARIIGIAIPASVTVIGGYVRVTDTGTTTVTATSLFKGCTSLASITVDPNNPSYTSEGGILYNKAKTWLVRAPEGMSGTVTIPAGVTNIRESAFWDCTRLTSITIPEGVRSFGEYTFYGCTSLTSIHIPASLTTICAGYGVSNKNPFTRCTNLASITVNPNNPDYSTEGGILYNKSKTTLVIAPPAGISGNVTIPASVRSLESGAFSYCASLTSIVIPEGVRTIGYSVFNQCTKLASITIPASVTSIGNYAFMDCTSLISITIPAGVTSIGSSAFYNCTSLTSVTIHEGVTSIESVAFGSCTSLTSITIPSSVTSIGNSAFNGCTNLRTVTVSRKTTIGTYAFPSTAQITYSD